MMNQQYFIGIDIGAGSLTTMIIDLAGTVVGSASEDLLTRTGSTRLVAGLMPDGETGTSTSSHTPQPG
jgi:sugar (pentulose or hexulose) kinase